MPKPSFPAAGEAVPAAISRRTALRGIVTIAAIGGATHTAIAVSSPSQGKEALAAALLAALESEQGGEWVMLALQRNGPGHFSYGVPKEYGGDIFAVARP